MAEISKSGDHLSLNAVEIKQLYEFIGSTRSTLENLSSGVDNLNACITELNDTIKVIDKGKVDVGYCKGKHAKDAVKDAIKKPWYDYIPLLVSSMTLLVLISCAFVWLVKGPASITPALASDIQELVKMKDAIIKNHKGK